MSSDGGPDGAPFGALLRRHRGAQGLTQDELAQRSGLTPQAISMLERGVRRAPRTTTVELLADALKLDAASREALHAAARRRAEPAAQFEDRRPPRREPPARRLRGVGWRRAGAALGLVAVLGLTAAVPLAWWRSRAPLPVAQIASLVGARVANWSAANRDVGPLQTQRFFYHGLPISFAGTRESRLPAGVVPIVSYHVRTTNVVSYVRSVNRRVILIYQYNPEPRMNPATFVSQYEEQSALIRSATNPEVSVAMSANVYQYQSGVNPAATSCAYIPPPAYVDYYLAAVYEPYLQGIDGTDGGAFVVWQRCTSRSERPRGLAEYGLGLGVRGSSQCQPESKRADVMRHDMEYLHRYIPDLAILEYWWVSPAASATCARSFQFPAGGVTGSLWRAIATRTFGF